VTKGQVRLAVLITEQESITKLKIEIDSVEQKHETAPTSNLTLGIPQQKSRVFLLLLPYAWLVKKVVGGFGTRLTRASHCRIAKQA
jgi:hypothetical protein